MTRSSADPGFSPVGTRHSFEEAVEQIAYAIRSGRYVVGDKLPSERELASQMQISRPTVREAVHVLVDAGIVEMKLGASGGAFVVSEAVPLRLILGKVELRIGEVSAVLEARRLIEPRVAQLAALYGTEADFERMAHIIAQQRESGDDRDMLNQLDERFHLAMAEATRNLEIVAIMRELLKKLVIAWDMDYRQAPDPERAVAVHEETLEAIMSGDHARIEVAMDRHLSIIETLWEQGSGRARLREIPPFLRGVTGRA